MTSVMTKVDDDFEKGGTVVLTKSRAIIVIISQYLHDTLKAP